MRRGLKDQVPPITYGQLLRDSSIFPDEEGTERWRFDGIRVGIVAQQHLPR